MRKINNDNFMVMRRARSPLACRDLELNLKHIPDNSSHIELHIENMARVSIRELAHEVT